MEEDVPPATQAVLEPEFEEECTPRADDADAFASTQPPEDEPAARFVRESCSVAGALGQFVLVPEHGRKLEVGRVSAAGSEHDRTRACLLNSTSAGISRQHGWFRYDRHRGVEYTGCAGSEHAITFLNGSRLAPDAPTVVIKDGDVLGFGLPVFFVGISTRSASARAFV